MPKLTTHMLSNRNKAGEEMRFKVPLFVNVEGKFYARDIPEILWPMLTLDKDHRLWADSKKELTLALDAALRQVMEPTVTKEPVIRFAITCDVRFCVDDEGNVYPNGYATKKQTQWPDEQAFGKVGYRNAWGPAIPGQIVAVAAEAVTKITTTYGDKTKITYEPYHAGASHLSYDNPAVRLNHWHRAPDRNDYNVREIPYSDQAAEFFFDLMEGMARLAKLIQEHTFEEQDLLAAIAGNKRMLPKPRT